MKKTVRIGISGAGGRMGRKLLEIIYDSNPPKSALGRALKNAKLTAAVEHTEHPFLKMKIDAAMLAGQFDASNKTATEKKVLLSDTFDPKSVDVFIDFSTPAGAVALSKKCRQHNIAMVVGVTGFSKAEKKELEAAGDDIPLLISPNMSGGMLLMFDIVQKAAALFKGSSDVEICETHHNQKKDTPSGTALRLGEIVAKEIDGVDFDDIAVFNRKRQGNTRGENEIGFSSIRAGDIIGEHRVIFANLGEQIEIIHRSTDRITYATGAILAATRIVKQSAGVYSMEDIFKIGKKRLSTP